MTHRGRPPFQSRPDRINKNFKPNPRQAAWLAFLNVHGPQSSEYLYQYTKSRAKCYQTTKQMLKALWLGGMVHYPKQQRATDNTNYHHLVYDLTDRGKQYLKNGDRWVDAIRPSGPWLHQFMIATLTATMHIMCNRRGYRFIPGHEVLREQSLSCAVPFTWDGQRYEKELVPDSLFAIDYGRKFIIYALEADRNTEGNVVNTPHRKSARRSILQYKKFRDVYREHWQVNAPLVVLTVTTSQGHISHLLDLVQHELGDCSFLAFGHAPEFVANFWKPPKLMKHLFEDGLKRAGRPDFVIEYHPKSADTAG